MFKKSLLFKLIVAFKTFSTAVPMLKVLLYKGFIISGFKKVYDTVHQQSGNEARYNGFYKIALPSIIFTGLYETTI